MQIMTLKSLILAGAAAASLAAPAVALADPAWGDHGGWNHQDGGWRGDHRGDFRDGDHRGWGWRDHDGWRGGYRYGWGYGYDRGCYTTERGYHNWYGEYVVRPVQVCR